MGKSILVSKFLDSMIMSHQFSKRSGRYIWISDHIQTVKKILTTDIIDDEWKSYLTENYSDGKTAYYDFMTCINNSVKNIDTSTFIKKIHNIDAIGALIGETAIIPGCENTYEEFINLQFSINDKTDNEIAQNQIMVATAHLLKLLDNSNKENLLKYMTPGILNHFSELYAKKKIFPRIVFNMETIMKEYMGVNIYINDFYKIPDIILNSHKTKLT